MAVLFLPFGYPGYPAADVKRHIEVSRELLRSLGLKLVSADDIITLDDCSQAIGKACSGKWDCVIVLLATWVEAPNILRVISSAGLEHVPMLLWAHDNVPGAQGKPTISFGSIASAGVLRETFEEMGFRFRFVVGNPGDAKLSLEISSFCRAASAKASLSNARLGMVGFVSMGMYTGISDNIKVKKLLGAEIVHVDQYSLISHIDSIDSEAVKVVSDEIHREWRLSPSVEPGHIEKTARIYLRMMQIVKEQQLDAVSIKCQYEMSMDYGFTPCVALSLLGGRMPTSCEGDMYLLLSQMILAGITGNVTTYGDVLAFKEKSIVCAACGFAPKCYLEGERPVIDKHTALYSGLLITSTFKPQEVTLMRLANDGTGFKMHIVCGSADGMKNFHEIGCPAYAGAEISLENKSVPEFAQEIMSQHYAIVPGNCTRELADFCMLCGIRTI